MEGHTKSKKFRLMRVLRQEQRRLEQQHLEKVQSDPSREFRACTGLLRHIAWKYNLERVIVRLHPRDVGYTVVLRNTQQEEIETPFIPYTSDSFLDDLEHQRISPLLDFLLSDWPVNYYYDGCVLVEIKRGSPSVNISNCFILLQPSARTHRSSSLLSGRPAEHFERINKKIHPDLFVPSSEPSSRLDSVKSNVLGSQENQTPTLVGTPLVPSGGMGCLDPVGTGEIDCMQTLRSLKKRCLGSITGSSAEEFHLKRRKSDVVLASMEKIPPVLSSLPPINGLGLDDKLLANSSRMIPSERQPCPLLPPWSDIIHDMTVHEESERGVHVTYNMLTKVDQATKSVVVTFTQTFHDFSPPRSTEKCFTFVDLSSARRLLVAFYDLIQSEAQKKNRVINRNTKAPTPAGTTLTSTEAPLGGCLPPAPTSVLETAPAQVSVTHGVLPKLNNSMLMPASMSTMPACQTGHFIVTANGGKQVQIIHTLPQNQSSAMLVGTTGSPIVGRAGVPQYIISTGPRPPRFAQSVVQKRTPTPGETTASPSVCTGEAGSQAASAVAATTVGSQQVGQVLMQVQGQGFNVVPSASAATQSAVSGGKPIAAAMRPGNNIAMVQVPRVPGAILQKPNIQPGSSLTSVLVQGKPFMVQNAPTFLSGQSALLPGQQILPGHTAQLVQNMSTAILQGTSLYTVQQGQGGGIQVAGPPPSGTLGGQHILTSSGSQHASLVQMQPNTGAASGQVAQQPAFLQVAPSSLIQLANNASPNQPIVIQTGPMGFNSVVSNSNHAGGAVCKTLPANSIGVAQNTGQIFHGNVLQGQTILLSGQPTSTSNQLITQMLLQTGSVPRSTAQGKVFQVALRHGTPIAAQQIASNNPHHAGNTGSQLSLIQVQGGQAASSGKLLAANPNTATAATGGGAGALGGGGNITGAVGTASTANGAAGSSGPGIIIGSIGVGGSVGSVKSFQNSTPQQYALHASLMPPKLPTRKKNPQSSPASKGLTSPTSANPSDSGNSQ